MSRRFVNISLNKQLLDTLDSESRDKVESWLDECADQIEAKLLAQQIELMAYGSTRIKIP